MKLILLLAVLLNVPAFARVIDSNTKETYPAVIKLDSDSGICTGTVVGLYPPTVITARHCVEMGNVRFMGNVPETILKNEFGSSYFSTSGARLPGDIAVLIYSFRSDKDFRTQMSDKDLFVIGKETITAWQKFTFCGYGSTGRMKNEIAGIGTQRCGKNSFITEDFQKNYSTEVDLVYKLNAGKKFSEFYSTQKAKLTFALVQTFLAEYGKGTRLGMGALMPPVEGHPYGQFDEGKTLSLIQQGDSGGPVFITKNGQNILVAVNSAALSVEDIYIGAFFWRVDHSFSKDLMRKAYNYGGDLKGINEFLSEEKR